VDQALEEDKLTFFVELQNSGQRGSVTCAAKRMVPAGMRVRTTLRRRGSSYVCQVTLIGAQTRPEDQ
jgi:hypothetical protein